MSLASRPPSGHLAIERFLVEELPALGPPPRGIEGLERARRFFARLGDPQEAALQIHVVGTAGKGTAAAAIVSRLVGGGLRVGAHLSPHVYDVRERLLIDGALPSWEQVGAAIAELWPAMVAMTEAEGRPPSFFEVTTALSWCIGRSAGVEVHVTEAGIGGELDATNTIDRTDKITVVMPIGYDHLEILGADLRGIARTKASVIAPGSDVVVSPQPHREALEVVLEVAGTRGATVHRIDEADLTPSAWQRHAEMIGEVVAELVAARHGETVPPGRAPVVLPGRLERMTVGGRTLVLDGAHNPIKLRAVSGALAPDRPALLIAALSHEKVLDTCAAELATIADRIIATDFAVHAGDRVVRRSWSGDELAAALGEVRPDVAIDVVPGLEAAVAAALSVTSPGDTIVATGSFMMLGPVRQAAFGHAGVHLDTAASQELRR